MNMGWLLAHDYGLLMFPENIDDCGCQPGLTHQVREHMAQGDMMRDAGVYGDLWSETHVCPQLSAIRLCLKHAELTNNSSPVAAEGRAHHVAGEKPARETKPGSPPAQLALHGIPGPGAGATRAPVGQRTSPELESRVGSWAGSEGFCLHPQ